MIDVIKKIITYYYDYILLKIYRVVEFTFS